MKRSRRNLRAVCLLAAAGAVLGAATVHAGPILTVTYSSGDVLYPAGGFTHTPHYYLSGQFALPQFDTSWGRLLEVKATPELVRGDWGKAEADNEESIHYSGDAYREYFSVAGYFRGALLDQAHWPVVDYWEIKGLTGSRDLDADNEQPHPRPADFMGTDYGMFSGGPVFNRKEVLTLLPEMPPGVPQEADPVVGKFVGSGTVNIDYVVDSSLVVYVDRCARRYTHGDVVVAMELRYTYDVPEPATLALVALAAPALLVRRRRR